MYFSVMHQMRLCAPGLFAVFCLMLWNFVLQRLKWSLHAESPVVFREGLRFFSAGAARMSAGLLGMSAGLRGFAGGVSGLFVLPAGWAVVFAGGVLQGAQCSHSCFD